MLVSSHMSMILNFLESLVLTYILEAGSKTCNHQPFRDHFISKLIFGEYTVKRWWEISHPPSTLQPYSNTKK
ncbi:uncharacterized protein DS421_10g301710 [Arachis hypogaea]|nr:uncharacterized protein DS421_10g301710 [Arachis hypogaea]